MVCGRGQSGDRSGPLLFCLQSVDEREHDGNRDEQLPGGFVVQIEPGERGAQTLRLNGYKVPLMRNLVKRAIRGVPAASTTRRASRFGVVLTSQRRPNTEDTKDTKEAYLSCRYTEFESALVAARS